MAAITQTITIVDKSNKVVSSAKQLKGVFAEAKYAYLARKAEIKAERKRKEEVELQKAIKACSIADEETRSQVSESRSRRPDGTRRRRSEREGDNAQRSGSNTPPTPGGQMSLGQFNEQLYGQPRAAPVPTNIDPSETLQRRWTDDDYAVARRASNGPNPLHRSYSATDIDLDLAYGEYNESDLAAPDSELQSRGVPNALIVKNPDKELSSLVLKCKMLLEEAECAGESVKAVIAHLQDNPEAMAAVALTLAEISNIASKMAPGALAALKGSAPTVMALLASPQFLIAVGAGIGVTVIMFGGYKIIKKIKATAEEQMGAQPMLVPGVGVRQPDPTQDTELLDVKELDRIEKWRRGITEVDAEVETGSVVSGTSVEGEFITPFAAQSMGHLPLKEKSKKSGGSHSSSKKDKEKDKDGSEKSKKHRRRRHKSSDRDGTESEGGHSTKSEDSKRKGSRDLMKISKPSPLRRMFTVHGSSSNTGWER